MTQIALPAARPAASFDAMVLPVTAFVSAALVFLVEPMMGRLVLPQLGGSSAVWNTSLAFFQAALLLGYGYAHLLQRIASVRTQGMIHLAVLAVAAVELPLRLSGALGEPPVGAPTTWLLGELTLSIGAPFAALSATAPLLQAWRARTGGEAAGSIHTLYAASNLGSLLALAAYPLLVEPNLTLADQRGLWTLGYGGFFAINLLLAARLNRGVATSPAVGKVAARPAAWRDRLVWGLLAAAPSSLMLGVTTHLSSDLGSAPFLWVAPLGLYLLTFVIAFRERAAGASSRLTLGLQAVAAALCLAALPFSAVSWGFQLGVNLAAFFLTALVCHEALVARRPAPEQLTEFYFILSLGGVVGGAFNAFLAPSLFNQVWEYPLVLVVANLARRWGARAWSRADLATLAAGLAGGVALVVMGWTDVLPTVPFVMAIGACAGAALLLRDRAPAFTGLVALLALGMQASVALHGDILAKRSFFGVHRVSVTETPGVGRIRRLIHGSTLHGAQMLDPARRCTPMTYYATPTPMNQAFALLHARKPAARIGVVGLGSGSIAALTAPGDTLRFYEIDPAVLQIARDDGLFSFVGDCAKGRIDYALGDGRLNLAHAPPGALDLLLIDAFSSDSVPTHLLTVQALEVYLRALAPDGVLVLHLTNRNLGLVEPAAAAVAAVGAHARVQAFDAPARLNPLVQSSTVMAVSRSPAALAAFDADGRWLPADARGVRAWTDDYTNLLGAFLAGPSDKRLHAPTGRSRGA